MYCALLGQDIMEGYQGHNSKTPYAGIIFWRDFAIFAHFFTQSRMKID